MWFTVKTNAENGPEKPLLECRANQQQSSFLHAKAHPG